MYSGAIDMLWCEMVKLDERAYDLPAIHVRVSPFPSPITVAARYSWVRWVCLVQPVSRGPFRYS